MGRPAKIVLAIDRPKRLAAAVRLAAEDTIVGTGYDGKGHMKFKISCTVDDDENAGQKILLLSVEVIPSPRGFPEGKAPHTPG
jgi:hypothetical protein